MRIQLLTASYCLFAATCFSFDAIAEPLELSVTAESAILINADTLAILYEKNPYDLYFPASITKIATAIYTLQNMEGKLDVKVEATQEAVGVVTEETKRRANYAAPSHALVSGGSHIGIKLGESLSLRDLLYGMMIASGNDAANVIAENVGGTIPQFMEGMNAYLKEIGCQSSTFTNPHGLHHPRHQTTAYDMAILTQEALKNPLFCQIVSSARYTRPKTNKQGAATLVQTNRLLRPGKLHYPKAIGVKTGYLSIAGNTLVGAAKDGERTLIAVLLKVKEREMMFKEAKKLFEAAFSQPKVQRILLKKGAKEFSLQLPGASRAITTTLLEDLTLEYYPAEEPKVSCQLIWDDALVLPIENHQRVGNITVKSEKGDVLKTLPVFSDGSVEPNMWYKLKRFFSGSSEKGSTLKVIGAIVFCLFFGFFIIQLRRRR